MDRLRTAKFYKIFDHVSGTCGLKNMNRTFTLFLESKIQIQRCVLYFFL